MNTNETKETIPPIKQKETTISSKVRQILIETDGTNITLVKAEVAGKIELIGILQTIISYINQPSK